MQPKRSEPSTKKRLETQIHRRKKAKAFSPLLSEWDRSGQNAPAHLRMDATSMAPKPPQIKKK